MSSKMQTDTLLALLNKPSAQWGGSRTSSLRQLMMADTLCVLNICVCSLAPPRSTNDRRKWKITSCFYVWAKVEGKLWWCFIFLCVCVCSVCVLLNVLLVAHFIRDPDVLIAKHCQQSGHKKIMNHASLSGHLYCICHVYMLLVCIPQFL